MKLIKTLELINTIFEKVFIAVAGALLISMVLMTCVNIVMRWFWVPLRGTFELMGLMGAVIVTFALAYTQSKKEHISVDIMMHIFPAGLRRVFAVINDMACICFSLIAAWQIIRLANNILASGEVTETLRIIFHPFIYAVGLGFIALSMVFLTDICRFIFTKGDNPK